MTGSPATGVVPPKTVTVAVKTWVVAPSAGSDFVAGVTVTTFAVPGGGLLVWVMVAEPLLPVPASVAVTVQNPTVADAVYVTLAVPVASVVAVVALKLPHAAADGLPVATKVTVSPTTSAVLLSLTSAETVDVSTPLAFTADGAAVTRMLFGTFVWVTVAEPLRPFCASVAVIVHVPTVALVL
jgi:hypothetical protein